jgi:hypothetical protein
MRRLLVLAALASACSSSSSPECDGGDVRYEGRPPPRLFAYETECRDDCFTSRVKGCERACDEISVSEPVAYVRDERSLVLVDPVSLGGDRALIHRFGWRDQTGGNAPAQFSFSAAGTRRYRSGQLLAPAIFEVSTWVAPIEPYTAGGQELLRLDLAETEVLAAEPAELSIEIATDERIIGKFFLAYENGLDTQGQVNGCFDLSSVATVDDDQTIVRVFR